MGEPKLTSSKRKQPCTTTLPHNPFSGIFTRSKSQIYLHRNRSGRAHRDASRLDLYRFQPVSKKPRRWVSTKDGDSSYVNDLSCISIKDLRTRRVFSNGCGLREENEEGKRLGGGQRRLESGFSCNSCFGEDNSGKVDKEFCCEDVNVDGENPSLVLEEPRNDEGVGGLNEECEWKTPPDTEVLTSKREVEQSGSERVVFVSKVTDEFVDKQKQSNGSDRKNDNCIGGAFSDSIDKRNGTDSGTKPVLTPCSREKVFKVPGSFSYRRMLPYLMDISKDNSYAPKEGQSPKCEKGPEEKKLLTSLFQEVLITGSGTENCPVQSNNLDLVDESNVTSIECIKECSISFESQKEVSIVEEWSKTILEGGIERFHLKNYGEDQKLNTSNSSTSEGFCAPQNISTLNGSLCSTINKCDSRNDNTVGESPEVIKQCTTGGMHKSDVADTPQVKNIYQTNSNLRERGQIDSLSKADERDNNDVEAQDHGDNSNEECVQMTPPDADIFEKVVDQKAPGRPLEGGIYRNTSCLDDKGTDSSPRQKPVLNRCSRLKLFKTPGSMSYRRMLPFLMDVTKDNSYASAKGHCVKHEKSLEAKVLSQTLVSGYQDMPIGNSISNNCQAQSYNAGHSALPIKVSTASSNDQEPMFSAQKDVNESPEPLNSQEEWEVLCDQNLSETERKFGTAPENMDIILGSSPSATPLCSHVSSVPSSKEDAKVVANELSINSGENCSKSLTEVADGSKQIVSGSLYQDSSHHGTPFHLDILATDFKKGILKKTPRGCRGLCTCLNCSSFQLHAQRAFEFSRNQMQDAEEVALNLIKELSYIRNMLEKSAFSADGCAGASISQVKEACRRAAEAEVLAQDRLSQMNFDLNIHCRITRAQRPRVRFANNVEEKFITRPNLPSK